MPTSVKVSIHFFHRKVGFIFTLHLHYPQHCESSLIGMLRFAHEIVDLPLTDAWTMASLAPSRVIGVDQRKGSLAPGKDADIILTDCNLAIKAVYARGKSVNPHRPSR